VAYSEIEPFPCKVLQHHYPTVPNLGDMTKFKGWPDADVDVFVGGTPCQSFSVAGLRKGLDDPRGNLMLTYLAIAKQYRPNWLVWENVPGVLSSAEGRDFGSFLGGLAILGYGFAYRVLDAQYFGVAQRRKRVFVVGYLGDWRPAAAVLFERHSLQGHPAPSRKKGKSFAASIASGAPISDYDVAGTLDKGTPGRGIGHNGNYDSQVVSVGSLCARTGQSRSVHGVAQPIAFSGQMSNPQTDVDMTQTLGAKNPMAVAVSNGHGWWSESDGTAQTIALAENTIGRKPENGGNGDGFTDGGPMYTLNATGVHGVAQAMAVRRLTPIECERLQGFPDRYTDIQPKGKATPDGPRYKALGNSMAVPVMGWIGKRIQEVDAVLKTRETT